MTRVKQVTAAVTNVSRKRNLQRAAGDPPPPPAARPRRPPPGSAPTRRDSRAVRHGRTLKTVTGRGLSLIDQDYETSRLTW